MATRLTTAIQERQKYPRFGDASRAFKRSTMACIVLKRDTSLKLSSCSENGQRKMLLEQGKEARTSSKGKPPVALFNIAQHQG